MKFLRSKTFLGVICIIIAAAIAFLLLPQYYSSQSSTVQAVRVAQDIPAGTIIDASMITTSEVGAFGLSDDVVLSKDEAINMVAVENLFAGELLMSQRLLAKETYEEQVKEESLGLIGNKCLVSIQFPSTSTGVPGCLRAGNIVDVYEYVEDEEENISVNIALENMYVYDVLNSTLQSLNDLDERLEAAVLSEEETDFDFEPLYVTFLCTSEQALTLVRLEKAESLHLVLRNTGG